MTKNKEILARFACAPIDTFSKGSGNCDGLFGSTFESALGNYFGYHNTESAANACIDLIVDRRHVEVKTNAGGLCGVSESLFKNRPWVVFCPLYNPERTPLEQVAFFLSRRDFIEMIAVCELSRKKCTTSMYSTLGYVPNYWGNCNVITLQTLYNYKEGKFNCGGKFARMVEYLENLVDEGKALTLTEFLEGKRLW